MTAYVNINSIVFFDGYCSIEIGLFLINVTKFACSGKISNGPSEFSEESEDASPSHTISVGDFITIWSTSLSEGVIHYFFTLLPLIVSMYKNCSAGIVSA